MKYVLKLLKERIDTKQFRIENYLVSGSEILEMKKQIRELKKAIKVLENKK